MKISKTAFKEYSKCSLAYPLEQIYYKKDNSLVSTEFGEEKEEKIKSILSSMYDSETGDDLIEKVDEKLEVMLPLYKEVEKVASECAEKTFNVSFNYIEDNSQQKRYSYISNENNEYYTYLDLYYEDGKEAIIIEVKSASTNEFLKLGPKIGDKVDSIFEKIENIIRTKAILSDKQSKHYSHLFERNHAIGKYIFDIAIERYIIENSTYYKANMNKRYRYYLGVLNKDFVHNGEYKDNKPFFYNNNILPVSFIDVSEITKQYMPIIAELTKKVEDIIIKSQIEKPIYCLSCKKGDCRFYSICFPKLQEKNNITEVMGTKKIGEYRISELINQDKFYINSFPKEWLSSDNQIIQRECFDENKQYVDKDKIKKGLDCLKYPIYHLDFETFASPLPRFKGEKPYDQSVFQYSIHIEKQPGICDEKDDNHYFVAKDYNDHREELIKEMIKTIDLSKGGTVLVYNDSFEKSRLFELAEMFPKYRNELLEIREHVFDLKDIISTSKKLYLELGYGEDEAKKINFYDVRLHGSYSIKKVLPVFTNRSYDDLNIKNGTDAVVNYAKFKNASKEETEEMRQNLITYCGLDTYSMVEILRGIRKLVN